MGPGDVEGDEIPPVLPPTREEWEGLVEDRNRLLLQVQGANATVAALQMALDGANLQLSEAKDKLVAEQMRAKMLNTVHEVAISQNTAMLDLADHYTGSLWPEEVQRAAKEILKAGREASSRLRDAERLIDEARKKADAAWRLYDHSEECPVSQDTEDDERKANCECSTGEIEAILDILNKNEKRKCVHPPDRIGQDHMTWRCADCGEEVTPEKRKCEVCPDDCMKWGGCSHECHKQNNDVCCECGAPGAMVALREPGKPDAAVCMPCLWKHGKIG